MPDLSWPVWVVLLLVALWAWSAVQPEAHATPLCPCGCGRPAHQHNPPRSAA